jgi:NADPH:quinone reductase-like Zn-dependent oxidoreductase
MVVAATHPTADGSHADYTVVAETATALLPPGVTMARAAALPFAALTAWRALNGLARVQSGQTVVVHGAAGSVGSFATQYLANHVGCRVIGTCRPDKISQLQQQCSQATFLSVEDFLAATADATTETPQQHDLACDVVLDGLGRGVADGAVQRQSLAVLREGGHLLDLNGQFIRAIDGLGDVARGSGAPTLDQTAASPGSGPGGGPIEFNFASQLKATAKAAAELAGAPHSTLL